jgi:ribonucleoside-diphosphate reductase alpha chain
MAAYLPVDHPDILEFLKIKSEGNPIQDLSIGVCISDEWMESLLNKDKDKLKIWGEIIKKRFESGYPYVFFTGTANKNAPKVYRDKGIKIHASNLCVTGDTLIDVLIDDEAFQIKIEELGFYLKKHKNIKVKSFDVETEKEVFSEILDFAQTGESEELYEIEDENGNVVKCTGNHKIYTQNRGYVEARLLEETDILVNAK